MIFPPEAATTTLRPHDLILWSNSCQLAYIIQPTVPWKDAIGEAYELIKPALPQPCSGSSRQQMEGQGVPGGGGDWRVFMASRTVRLLEVGGWGQADRQTCTELANKSMPMAEEKQATPSWLLKGISSLRNTHPG